MSLEKKREKHIEEDNGESDGDRRTVTEEEVDEFFKILRRVHVATRTVTKVNGGVVEPSKKRKRSQSLGLRNSLDTNGERDGVNRVGLMGLDLNSKPEPDCVSL
ncbi:hypothetical protein AALP_AA5G229800 [Arabis alpina]|uniref:Protein NIM1-INTERACTING 2 n=1 Tax=Arabis alpina TaxID=50452 RepID=A0A087GYV8_ARAAL|nr:hypothetical protein AALP_AA5G229800 [Arabis alpina]